MKNLYLILFNVVFSIAMVWSVIMDPDNKESTQLPPEDPRTFNEVLQTCLAKRVYGTMECINRGALATLQVWNDDECLDFDGIRLERNEGESRNIFDLDWDPKDFGNVVKAASRLMERRNMKWDLGGVYPGLQMRVGPTLSAGNGVLEFVVDERQSNNYHHHNRQLGTGRLLMRQLVLPFLLGFKFNLAALLPLLFGFLIIITKKALLLTKVALIIAGLLGWNSIFNNFANGPSSFYPHNGAYTNPGFTQTIGGFNPLAYQDINQQYLPYRGEIDSGIPFGQHVIREIVNVYETANQENEENNRRKKNLIWTRNES